MRSASMVFGIALASLAGVALAGVALSGVAVGAAAAQTAAPPEGVRPACVEARAEARMQAYGFDHFVIVRSECPTLVECRISTDVNPTPTTIRLAPGETRETLTWRGSPASAFAAQVACELR